MNTNINKSETYTFFYELFSRKLFTDTRKIAGVITDKQCVTMIESRDTNRMDMMQQLLEQFGADNYKYSKRDVYFFGIINDSTNKIDFNLPEFGDSDISFSRYCFFIDLLDALDAAKKESNINFEYSIFQDEEIDSDIERVKKEIEKKLIKEIPLYHRKEPFFKTTKETNFHDEAIITSTTHDNDVIKEEILFNLDISGSKDFPDLFSRVILGYEYYTKDDAYIEVIYDAIPNLDQIYTFSVYNQFRPIDSQINQDELSINNLQETLLKICDELYFKKPTNINSAFDQINKGLSLLYNVKIATPNLTKEAYEIIERIYPNFLLINRIISDEKLLDLVEDDFSTNPKSGYNEISKSILNDVYKQKNIELVKIQNALEEFRKQESIFDRTEKAEEYYNLHYSEIIQNYNNITNTNNLLTEYLKKIELLKNEKIEENNSLIGSLEERANKLQEALDGYSKENKELEQELQKISGIEITFEQLKERIENRKNDKDADNVKRKTIQDSIQILISKLDKKKTELDELEKTGLIMAME